MYSYFLPFIKFKLSIKSGRGFKSPELLNSLADYIAKFIGCKIVAPDARPQNFRRRLPALIIQTARNLVQVHRFRARLSAKNNKSALVRKVELLRYNAALS
jgi:hypothetical protein